MLRFEGTHDIRHLENNGSSRLDLYDLLHPLLSRHGLMILVAMENMFLVGVELDKILAVHSKINNERIMHPPTGSQSRNGWVLGRTNPRQIIISPVICPIQPTAPTDLQCDKQRQNKMATLAAAVRQLSPHRLININ